MQGRSIPPKPGPRRSRRAGSEDWISNQLKRVYDETVQESIPAEMLDLLRQLDEIEIPQAERAGDPSAETGDDDGEPGERA